MLRHRAAITKRTTGARDSYGNPTITTATTSGVPCFCEAQGKREDLMGAVVAVGTYRLYMDPRAEITEQDVVTVTDINGSAIVTTAEVTGVMRIPGRIGTTAHIEAIIKPLGAAL